MLFLAVIGTATLFASPWDIPISRPSFKSHTPWDRPLQHTVFTPAVAWALVGVVDEYNVELNVALTEYDPIHDWRVSMSVQGEWYVRVGFTTWQWQPVTYLWDVDIPAGTYTQSIPILLARRSRFTMSGMYVANSEISYTLTQL